MQNVKIVMVNRYWYSKYGKNKYAKMGFNVLIFAIWPLFSGSSRNILYHGFKTIALSHYVPSMHSAQFSFSKRICIKVLADNSILDTFL